MDACAYDIAEVFGWFILFGLCPIIPWIIAWALE